MFKGVKELILFTLEQPELQKDDLSSKQPRQAEGGGAKTAKTQSNNVGIHLRDVGSRRGIRFHTESRFELV